MRTEATTNSLKINKSRANANRFITSFRELRWGCCKYPGKMNHSLLDIFRHTDYVPRGDRYAQDPF
ncbi:hypothetical protein LAN16_23670, partial [Mycobacterium tuberculosis]|nr:hypothetical protein [Mycobacterium tuberculosis]